MILLHVIMSSMAAWRSTFLHWLLLFAVLLQCRLTATSSSLAELCLIVTASQNNTTSFDNNLSFAIVLHCTLNSLHVVINYDSLQ